MSKKVALIHRDMWEAKALLHARSKLALAMLAIVHYYWGSKPEYTNALLRLIFPGYTQPSLPTIVTDGCKIAADGSIRVGLMDRQLRPIPDFPIFTSLKEMESEFRTLADQLKLNDKDRIDMFAAIQNWIVGDARQRPEAVEAKPRLEASNG